MLPGLLVLYFFPFGALFPSKPLSGDPPVDPVREKTSVAKGIEEAQGGMTPPRAGLAREEGVPMIPLVLGGGIAIAVVFYFVSSQVKQETPVPPVITKTPDKTMPEAKKETIPEVKGGGNVPLRGR